MAPIDHVYGTLGLVRASTTQQYSDVSKLREEIEGKSSFTMFAPSNDAWDLVESVSGLEVSNLSRECNKCHNYCDTHCCDVPRLSGLHW